MQTLETTRALSEIDRELIARVLRDVFACRASGDIDGMVEYLAADVVCFPDTPWSYAKYPFTLVGKEAIREAARQRHINYVVQGYEIHRVLIDGDQAAVHRTVSLRERGGGPTHTFDSVTFFRFREGLIVEISELPDGSARETVINFPH